MRLKLLLTIITVSLSSYIKLAQTGCPTIDITSNGGNDIVLPCDENCTDLEVIPFHADQTTNYTVGSYSTCNTNCI
jgi:hypothetical protein